VSSLAWEVFVQYMLRCILFPIWHGMVMFLACLDVFLILHRWLATNVEMHFARDMANILCNDRHAMGLVNTC
jgi:hypothetical protein